MIDKFVTQSIELLPRKLKRNVLLEYPLFPNQTVCAAAAYFSAQLLAQPIAIVNTERTRTGLINPELCSFVPLLDWWRTSAAFPGRTVGDRRQAGGAVEPGSQNSLLSTCYQRTFFHPICPSALLSLLVLASLPLPPSLSLSITLP